MSNLAQRAAANLVNLRKQKPLIHNITNYVVMNFTANVLLASGASPVMAHAEDEVEDMVSFAGALVLNIGTLSPSWNNSMVRAGTKASELKIPIILDPVGAGATPFRTETARGLLASCDVSIVRGNASEIMALKQEDSLTKGVDAVHTVDEVAAIASTLARELDVVVAITGQTDLITDGLEVLRVANGHSLMPTVTGTGCSATAIIGSFAAIDSNPLTAAAAALAFFGLAGERAGQLSKGPGSFVPALLDALYTITPEELASESLIEKI